MKSVTSPINVVRLFAMEAGGRCKAVIRGCPASTTPGAVCESRGQAKSA